MDCHETYLNCSENESSYVERKQSKSKQEWSGNTGVYSND